MSEDHNLIPARPIGNIYCGTCSWTDRTLIESGGFYPADVRSPKARLRYYAQVFPIVEVDATYYALPSEQNARLWVERTPPGFVFNIKAFGLLTQHPIRPAPTSRHRPRAAAKGRAGEGPALSRWRAGRCPRTRLDDAHRGVAAAGRGRKARLPAISVPT